MNNSNTGQQLRYLEEVCISLHRAGFETKPPEDCQLPILWNDAPLCRITGKGSVLYHQENVDSIRAQDVLQSVIDTAKMTSEYMVILEYAPRLKASGLTGDYRILADFAAILFQKTPFLSQSSLRRSTTHCRSSVNRTKAFRLDGIGIWRS